ncbi:MAG: hypothetical protein A4E62_03144 [Syntrophorhabdus sp. PtaU1.Bin002]|nr:MAG: hypothetical protein A4E62_03144 [Syntrophorhabdus sp. PtaU1.Bin002]
MSGDRKAVYAGCVDQTEKGRHVSRSYDYCGKTCGIYKTFQLQKGICDYLCPLYFCHGVVPCGEVLCRIGEEHKPWAVTVDEVEGCIGNPSVASRVHIPWVGVPSKHVLHYFDDRSGRFCLFTCPEVQRGLPFSCVEYCDAHAWPSSVVSCGLPVSILISRPQRGHAFP